MTAFLLKKLSAGLTIFALIMSGVVVAPERVQATFPVIDSTNFSQNIITAVKSTISAINDATTAGATAALQVDKYVLQPLAFAASGNLLQAMGADIFDFANGKSNGTGQPQYVQDYRGNQQRVGDTQAFAFLGSFSKNSNSPFAWAITSSLRTNYLQQTSLGGFFAANQSTLHRSSPNVNGFLSGDWTQGGAATWFALTTQNQNNPYTLYNRSNNQLGTMVGDAQEARREELGWGQGYLSWCGASGGALSLASANDPCINEDGSPGTILTPGSFIRNAVDTAFESPFNKLEGLGDAGSQIGSIIGNTGKILATVGTGVALLGIASGKGSGGFYASSQGGTTSYVAQYRSNPSYLGVSQQSVYRSAATIRPSGQELLDRVAEYEPSWNAINTATTLAGDHVRGLATYCRDQATQAEKTGGGDPQISQFILAARAQATAADEAHTRLVVPVEARVTQATTTVAQARALVARIQAELVSGKVSASSDAYANDVLAIQKARPTAQDIADALQEANTFITPSGSGLELSGGTLLSRMNALRANADTLRPSCTMPSATNSTS